MAKLVYGLSRSVDGYVDHMKTVMAWMYPRFKDEVGQNTAMVRKILPAG